MWERWVPVLDKRYRVLFRAAFGQGEAAAKAYRTWRAKVSLDDIDYPTKRILPLLVETSEKLGLQDEDTPRMRGIVKHFWISNVLRLQSLSAALAALDQIGVDALLLKGAALFARNEKLAAVRVTGDYDILVRRDDALRAIAALTAAGFDEEHSMRPDLFTDADFASFHGAHLVNGAHGSLDLHWRPLPDLPDPAYVDEMFAHAEFAQLAGRRVSIPGLADHLFLTVVKPEPWLVDETFYRAIEAAHILRDFKGKLDWERFERLVYRHRKGWMAASMLRMISKELQAPIPDGIIERIWRDAAPFPALELALRHNPSNLQRPFTRWALRAFDIARTEPVAATSSLGKMIAILFRSSLRAKAIRAAKQELLPWLGRSAELEELWRDYAARETDFGSASVVFPHGFSYPESGGRWTNSKFAVLEMPVDAPIDASVRVRLVVRPYLPPGAKRFAFDTATGTGRAELHVLTTKQDNRFETTVAARAVGIATRKAVIAFRLVDAACPSALGLADDPRLLGLCIQSVEIVQD
jgi:putative nucleotidyltransferase-like protein